MMDFKLLTKYTRVVCPECEGYGKKKYYNEYENYNELKNCRLCGGDMIVIESVVKTYKRVNG